MKSQTHNGSLIGYYVEARDLMDANGRGVAIYGTRLTKEWKRLRPTMKPCECDEGVPNPIGNLIANQEGVLTYPTAMSLITFQASNLMFQAIDFRLVKVRFEFSWSITTEGIGEEISFDHTTERKLKFEPVVEVEEER